MKEEREYNEVEMICSEEYKDFLEFHSSILDKVKKNMSGDMSDKLACMKKIEEQSYEVFELLQKCQQNLQKKVGTVGAVKAPTVFKEDYSLADMPINRYEVYLTESPLKREKRYCLYESGTVIVIGDTSKKIDKWLQSLGLKAQYIPEEEDCEEMVKYFDSSFVGVLGIAKKDWTEERGYQFVKQMFFAAKHTANTWYKERVKPFFVAVSRLGGTFGIEGTEKDFVTASISGLCKTAVKEWMDNVSVHYLDVDVDMDDTELTKYIMDELQYGDIPEVGYPASRKRTVFALKERYEDKVDQDNLPSEDDVFLAAGGGEGVTAACIMEFAKRFRSKFILFGMNQYDEDYVEQYEGKGREEIREIIAKDYKRRGEKIILADADRMARAILSQRQLHNTIKTLQEAGSQVLYFQCNIMDKEKLHEMIRIGTEQLGKITGIIHGAGVLSDSLLNKKTIKDFETVFGVKYYGINNMVEEVGEENLKYLFLYSSIAGFFGNFGQSDYSCGNEYLNHYARYFNNTHPNCKVMSLNWGPWNGGMVDHALKSAMLRRGKVLIDLDVGKMFFVDAFAKVWEPSACQVVINDVADLGGDF